MKCDDVQAKLIDLLYDELEVDEAACVHEHLATCATCRRDFEQLRATKTELSEAPGLRVAVDVPRIHAETARRALKARRRWGWTALAAAVLAGVVVSVGAVGMRVEVEAKRVVVSWGSGGARQKAAKTATSRELGDRWRKLDEHEARLAHLDDLMRLVVAELDNSEQRQRALLTAVARQVAELQTLSNVRWDATEQDVKTLYQWAQYTATNPTEGGE